jgi:hypothetical protein
MPAKFVGTIYSCFQFSIHKTKSYLYSVPESYKLSPKIYV